MLLNEVLGPDQNQIKNAVLVLCSFIDGTVDGGADFTRIIRILSQAFPESKYHGPMRRVMKAPRYIEPRDIRTLTTTMHQYIQRTNNARRFFSWTTLPPEDTISHLSVGGKKGLWLCIEQEYYGFDVAKCLRIALASTIVQFNDDERHVIETALETADWEREIIAAFSNGVHVIGVHVNYEFYDINNLKAAFNAFRFDALA